MDGQTLGPQRARVENDFRLRSVSICLAFFHTGRRADRQTDRQTDWQQAQSETRNETNGRVETSAPALSRPLACAQIAPRLATTREESIIMNEPNGIGRGARGASKGQEEGVWCQRERDKLCGPKVKFLLGFARFGRQRSKRVRVWGFFFEGLEIAKKGAGPCGQVERLSTR